MTNQVGFFVIRHSSFGFHSYRLRLPNRHHHPHHLVDALIVFALGGGVRDHAGAGLHVGGAVFQHHGAQGNARVGVAVVPEVADGAGVDVALALLELIDDLHRAHLGRSADSPGREGGPHHVVGVAVLAEAALDVRDDVHDV